MQSSSYSPFRSTGGQTAHVDRLVTNLFRDLATNENLIELRRQDLSRHPDFEPMSLFQHVDRSGDGRVTIGELYDFMSKQFLNPRMCDVEDILREYDGTQDSTLDFEEFSQLILPSTNPNLRHIASTRRFSPYFRTAKPICYEILSLLTRLLEKEMQLQRTRNDSKRQLADCQDFVKIRAFDNIAKGYQNISMPDLSYYLERNGFYPRREDVEAILRRCDHDANRSISYAEFCELASVVEAGDRAQAQPASASAEGEAAAAEDGAEGDLAKDEEADAGFNDRVEDVEDGEDLRQGPGEKASAEKSQGSAQRRKKAPADNLTPAQRQQKRDEEERLAAQQRADLEQQIEAEKQKIRAEQERQEQLDKERQVENFMFLRFVKHLIRSNRLIEDARSALFCHKTFSLEDSFRLFDVNKNGLITTQELTQVFREHNIELTDQQRLVELLDDDEDGSIDYREWVQALKPRCQYRMSDPASPYLSVEQKNLFQRAWLEQLAALFSALIQVDAETNDKRNQLQLDGERLFNDMDKYNMGFINVNNFAHWVSDNCGYHIEDGDLPLLEKTLDGVNDYRITREGFVDTISVPQEPEEQEAQAVQAKPQQQPKPAPKQQVKSQSAAKPQQQKPTNQR